MLSALWEWIKGLFQGKGSVQVGKGNQSVSGVTTGDVSAPMAVGNHNVINFVPSVVPSAKLDELEPTPMEVEILQRLENSQSGYLTTDCPDGFFGIIIDRAWIGGPYEWERDISVQLHEAVERLLCCGLLSDIQRDGKTYHLSSKGRDVAQRIQK
jgi:hypothetical protein